MTDRKETDNIIDVNELPPEDDGCTCLSGEFVTQLCPVHHKTGITKDKPVEINDGHLLFKGEKIAIQGYLFQCPACLVDCVLINETFIPQHCPNCRMKIEVKSKTFTDFIRANK